MTWGELLYLWIESERHETKEKKKCIRFTPRQEKLLQKIAYEAGYGDISSFVRFIIRKFLEDQARGEND